MPLAPEFVAVDGFAAAHVVRELGERHARQRLLERARGPLQYRTERKSYVMAGVARAASMRGIGSERPARTRRPVYRFQRELWGLPLQPRTAFVTRSAAHQASSSQRFQQAADVLALLAYVGPEAIGADPLAWHPVK